MNNTVCVYWIRHQDHTDIFSQGYVGISNSFEVRLRNHKSKPTNIHMKNVINKYGWDNLIKEKVLIATQDYCVMIEKQLRPNDFIGWNQTAGGGVPPKAKKGMGKGRKLSEEVKRKIGEGGKGRVFSIEAREKIRQAALKQWERYRANGNKHTPEPAEE
jgi:hypothetical protein